ncbi:hypothetical protein QJQ58_15690 [Paenibacillus dendritiformis]|uniref:hypothetical protein n=1 Tax=Paenibacillus dendritiformis TaxID=130049 RepID=UPI00248CD4B3|nr:hypothetical protein [Paenibacillus dendritiformis]WGU92054.1 hypothetical protein QJQ58_15690 [Paenibacillus dendritiformis]
MAHGVVRLDKVQASYNGNMEHIVHTADLDNGSFVHVGALKAGEREIKNAVVPTKATLKQEVVLIAAPEVIYDGSQGKQLDKFYTPAGKAARAYHLVAGDIITISDDMITGTTKVDEYVVPQDGSVKLAAVATDDGSTRFVAKVIAKEIFGSSAKPVSVIQVLNV